MRIWSIILSGTSLALGLGTPALAGTSSPVMGKGLAGPRPSVSVVRSGMVHSGPRFQRRWFVGWHAPGGWAAYRRPVVGYVLPPYWVHPAYRIGNYGAYGLPAPTEGYGWSRYYDDAVMTDRHGRVRDHRSDVGRHAHDGEGPPPGAAYDDDVTARDMPPPPPHEYEGRWTGTWRDEKGRTYSGEYEGRFEGEARSNYGVDYDAPPYAALPPTVHHDGPGQPMVTTTQAPGYFAGGYYYPGATTTTVVLQPAVTTTTTYVTQDRKRKMRRGCNCK
jgi:Ni/Co efflux regulator RcnB